jgi:CelD/BcsL family acetyltransferase involved in cellulose biosynthesis
MTATMTTVLFQGFDDPRLAAGAWNEILARGATNEVFLTKEYQTTWWEAFGRGRLLLIGVETDGRARAIAPLFADSGMVFFVGSGGSDYLDFIGVIEDAEAMAVILQTARDHTPGFVGCHFYHVPDPSPTSRLLSEAARRLQWTCYEENSFVAPRMSRQDFPAAVAKKSLVRHENWFRREGELQVCHWSSAEKIEPLLDAFFDQHVRRWHRTGYPSLFRSPAQRDFYRCLARRLAGTGWVRFTSLDWRGQAIAFHFGFSYRGSYLWYKPCFEIEWARRSPGEVLLRQLFWAAHDEGSQVFDFGLGDEAFKRRFASRDERIVNWGLYPGRADEPLHQGVKS